MLVIASCLVAQAFSAPNCTQVSTMSQAIQGSFKTNNALMPLYVRLGNKFNFDWHYDAWFFKQFTVFSN